MVTSNNELLKFLLVGVVNTAVGLGIIFVAWRYLGFSHLTANMAGYAVGVTLSYFLNRRWTFNCREPHRHSLWRFLAVVGAAYAANLWVVLAADRSIGADSFLPQLLGSVVYTAVGFMGSRLFAFRKNSRRPSPT